METMRLTLQEGSIEFLRYEPFMSVLRDDPECQWPMAVYGATPPYNPCEMKDGMMGECHCEHDEYYGSDDMGAPVFCKAHWAVLHSKDKGQSDLIPMSDKEKSLYRIA